MEKDRHLYILWTNDNPVTAEKMVFMYGGNSLRNGWWEEVTLIVWGATTELVSKNAAIQKQILELMEGGVKVSACKACADQLGVSDQLEALGLEVKYWGKPLTALLQSDARLLTI